MEEAEEQSMNAMPQMVGGEAGRVQAGGGEEVDMEDPMANYIREERVSFPFIFWVKDMEER